MISSADEARAFNLRYGRFDDCFVYRKSGPRGGGFYVTDLGRMIGERLKIEVPMTGVVETAPVIEGGEHRFFVKPKRSKGSISLRGQGVSDSDNNKDGAEARFCISKENVVDVADPQQGPGMPALSRWTRVDG